MSDAVEATSPAAAEPLPAGGPQPSEIQNGKRRGP